MVSSINLLTLVAPVLLGSASAGKTADRLSCNLKVGPSCNVTGWDRNQGNFDFDGSGDYGDFHTCSARCLASGQCSSFAYGDGECLLYDIPVAGNFDADPDSPFTFYDFACLADTSSGNTNSTSTPAGVIGTATSTSVSVSVSSSSASTSAATSTTTPSAVIGTATSNQISASSPTTTRSAVIGTATSTELRSTSVTSSTTSSTSAVFVTNRMSTTTTSSKAAVTTSKSSATTTKAAITTSATSKSTTTLSKSTTAKSSTITTSFKSATTAKPTTSKTTTSSSTSTVKIPAECTNIAPSVKMTTFDWFNSTHNLDCANPNFASSAQVCWDGNGLCKQGAAGCMCTPYCMTGVPNYAYQPLGFGPADTINVGLDGAGSTCFASNPSSIRRTELGKGHFDCGTAADVMGFTGDSNKDSGNFGSIYYNGVFNTCNGKVPVYKAKFALSCTHDRGMNATCTAASLPVVLDLVSLS